jgi:hypothetical protein
MVFKFSLPFQKDAHHTTKEPQVSCRRPHSRLKCALRTPNSPQNISALRQSEQLSVQHQLAKAQHSSGTM